MKQKSWNKAKRWLLRLGGGAVILCLAIIGFCYWINITPQVTIPTPVMPNPNGYDYFRRAGVAFVEDNKGVDEITNSSISSKPKKYPLAAKEVWLKKNAKAFQLLREGLKYPVLHPPIRSYSYIGLPEYAQYRELARALVVESHARGERGDWNGAVQSALDDYHFGNQIARGGPLITGLMSIAVRAISLRELGNLVFHTNVTTAKMAAAAMEKIYEERYPYYETLQEEKWLNIGGTLQVMKSPSGRMGTIHSFGTSIFSYPEILFMSKRKLISDLTRSMDELIKNAHQPYMKQRPVLAFGDRLMETMLPVFNRARWNWARGDTFSVLIMTMYALRAFQMDNGHYPANLQELTPKYLKKVPLDPFADDAPLQYRLQGQKYVLWSIGPDGVDNHGTPIINTHYLNRYSLKSAHYRFLSPDDKGDVVAGINMP